METLRSLLTGLALIAGALWVPGVAARPLRATLGLAAAASPLLLAFLLGRRGRATAAGRLAAVNLAAGSMLSVALFGGLQGPIVYSLPLSIAVVGLIRGRRAAVWTTVASGAFVAIEAVLEARGIAPFVVATLSPPSAAISVAVGIGMAFGQIAIYTREVSLARRDADQSARRALSVEHELADLVRFSPDGIALLDADGVIVMANDAMAAIAGRSAEALVGLGLPDLPGMADPATREAVLEGIARLHERGESLWEMTVAGPASGGLPVEVHARLLRAPGGRRGVQLVARDLSFRAEAREAQRRLETALREARRLEGLGRLAGGIAHDFRNLLTPITVNARALDRSRTLGPEERELVSEISLAAGRGNELTQQLLAFARRQEVELRPVALNGIVTELEPILRRLLRSDVALEVALGEELGALKGDRVQLEQVLVNLVANARDAIREGGGTIRITTENRTVTPEEVARDPGLRRGRFVALAVTDDGAGMTEEVRRRIFEPFFTTKGPTQGTGLGLATVHGIVSQARGAIEVESAPGRGTTFRVLFPRIDARPEVARGAEARPANAPPGARILVVDDDALVRSAVARALRSAGHGVAEASDGAEALELASRTPAPFDLLVTDLVMPRMAGRALARAVRRSHARQPVLFMSGYSADAAAIAADPDPGTDFLPKPFTREALLAKVSSLLEAA